MESHLDETIWDKRMVRIKHGFLVIHGYSYIDCDRMNVIFWSIKPLDETKKS